MMVLKARIYIQLNAQFVVKCLTFQISGKVQWQVMGKAKNIVNRHQQFLDPKTVILVKVLVGSVKVY